MSEKSPKSKTAAKKKTSKKKTKKKSTKKKQTKKSPKNKTGRDFKKDLSLVNIVSYVETTDLITKVKFKPEYIKQVEAHCEAGGIISDFARKIGVCRDTFEKWTRESTALKDAIVRGTAKFILSLPPKLVAHMQAGHSFESFAHVAGRSRSWLYDMVRVYDDFKEAKERGYVGSMYHWEKVLSAQSVGQLTRIAKEKPMVTKDENGNKVAVIDPRTGSPVMEKTHVPAMGSQNALIFAMKSRFEEYRDDKSDTGSELYNELKEICEEAEKEELEEARKNQGK